MSTSDDAVHSSQTPRSELEHTAWPELSDAFLKTVRQAGERRDVEEGEVLFDIGQSGYDFILVEMGRVRIVNRSEEKTITKIVAPAFVGELGLLMNQDTFLAAEADEASTIVVVPQQKLIDLVATVPEVADVVVSAYAARRRLLIEWQQGGMVIVGREGDAATVDLLEFASRNRIAYRFADRDDAKTMVELADHCTLPKSGTAVVLADNRVLEKPTTRELADAIGATVNLKMESTYDLAIVGAGPAGMAAAVYGASEGLSTVLIEDTAIGGQAGTSSKIENYLGFSTGIAGAELAYQGTIQAVKFGAQLAAPRRAVALRDGECADGRGEPCTILELNDGTEIHTRAVILANGVQYRKLPLDRLKEFEGAGVYYAATELEARFCRNTDAVIIGGGNSAGQAAMFLSRYAKCTHVVVRGKGLSQTMSSYLSERLEADEKVELVPCCEVVALHGDERLEAVTLRNRDTGDEWQIQTRALFIMIGAVPHTDWLKGTVDLDEKGFIKTSGKDGTFETSRSGVFAVGDIRAGSVKRVASAVGEGSVAISGVHAFLAKDPIRTSAEPDA